MLHEASAKFSFATRAKLVMTPRLPPPKKKVTVYAIKTGLQGRGGILT